MKATKEQREKILKGIKDFQSEINKRIIEHHFNLQEHLKEFDFIAITNLDETLGNSLLIDMLKTFIAEKEIENQLKDILK